MKGELKEAPHLHQFFIGEIIKYFAPKKLKSLEDADSDDDIIEAHDIDGNLFYFSYYNYAQELEYLFQRSPGLLQYLGKTSSQIGINPDYSIFYACVSNNAIDAMEVFRKYGYNFLYTHLECAIKNHAEASVKYLLSTVTLSEDEKLTLANLAGECGNVSIVSMLAPEDEIFYFRNILETNLLKTILIKDYYNRFNYFNTLKRAL